MIHRQRRGDDVWHSQDRCPEWPTNDFVAKKFPAIGRLCAQGKLLEGQGREALLDSIRKKTGYGEQRRG